VIIFVVHQGSLRYLKYCLRQLRVVCRTEKILWLGASKEIKIPGVVSLSLNSYSTAAKEFGTHYRHRSSNSVAFELFCFQRWFYIAEAAKQMGFVDEPILCLDSDALLYRVPSFGPSSEVDLATCRRTGPQYTWFKNLNVLEQFCRFMANSFTDPGHGLELDQFFVTKDSPLADHGGNVCDMHLLGLFSLTLGVAYRDLESRGDDSGIFYDDNLNVVGEFESERGSEGPKRVVWKNGLPHGVRNHVLIPFGGLHFQGGLKKRMSEFMSRPTPDELFVTWLKILSRGFRRKRKR